LNIPLPAGGGCSRLNPSFSGSGILRILKLVEEPVHKAVEKHGISIEEIRDIQYGKKFGFAHGLHRAELNIYYGKKGFSVVISPRCGTHDELNKLVHALVSELIFTPHFPLRVQKDS